MSEKKELSRSDLVRLRRERENTQRVERARKESTRQNPPPVARRSRQEVAQPRRRADRTGNSRSTRRRFQNALLPVAPDAEFRGVRVARPNLGKRLPSFLLVALLGAAIYFAFNAPQLQVTQAQVMGNRMLPPEEINAVLNIAGQPAFLLVPAKLERQLRLTFPEITYARVDVTLPNAVSVQVIERKPVIRWEQGTSFTWISEDGVAFRPRGEAPGLISVQAVSAPPTEGNISPDSLTPAPFISANMVRAIRGFANHVPPGAVILYDPDFGFGWDDPRGWKVYFGTSANDVELKMRVYESLVNSLTQRGIRPALINVTYPTAPYYRMSE